MQKFLRISFGVFFLFGSSLWAQKSHASRASANEDIGTVEVQGLNSTPVSITGSPELTSLANLAFSVDGRFRRVASGGNFEFRFTSAGAAQVRVDVVHAGAALASQTFSGTSERNALFRAADFAVKTASGKPGFFASRIAFVSTRSGASEIFVSDLFLGEARQVTHDNAHALTPHWSPDGQKLLYTSFFKSGFPDIFQIDLRSMQRTTFVSLKGTNTGARYSPSGNQVVMILSGEGNPEVYVSNAQGRQISRRTRTDGVESSPGFSPDGSQIVYASEPGPQIYIMSNSGGSPRRVPTGLSSYCAEPDWSYGDPSKLAFTIREGGGFQVAVVDLRTGTAKRVSHAPMDAIEPVWLADGRHLIYTARTSSSHNLYILDTESGRSTRLGSVQAEKASVWIAPGT